MSPLEEIARHPGNKHGIRLYLKRDDLLHPEISGNKWRKMTPLLDRFAGSGYEGIISFGGPFSNHLYALAAAGREFGIPTAAVIRGTAADKVESSTLRFATECGMQWHPVTKTAYDAGPDHPEIRAVLEKYPAYCVLPEGGSTPEGVRNCRHIPEEILKQTRIRTSGKLLVAVGAGTGGTAAGIVSGLGDRGRVLVFPATSHGFTENSVNRHFTADIPAYPFTLMSGYDFGGFAQNHPDLIDFIAYFKKETGTLLDPVYTGKMLYGLFDLLQLGFFPKKSVLVAVHTGGLQAWTGFKQRFGIEIQ